MAKVTTVWADSVLRKVAGWIKVPVETTILRVPLSIAIPRGGRGVSKMLGPVSGDGGERNWPFNKHWSCVRVRQNQLKTPFDPLKFGKQQTT